MRISTMRDRFTFLGAFATLRRGWRTEQLLPSILFDTNANLAKDLGLVPQDVNEALQRRRRGG
jgi:hypothetical protein